MKDETGGKKITEFVGLRPKMYSFTVHGEDNNNDTHLRAKGISRATKKNLRHRDYLEQLQRPTENRLTNRRFAYKLHKLHSVEFQKRGLCAFDDKRFLLEDGASQSLTFLVNSCLNLHLFSFTL